MKKKSPQQVDEKGGKIRVLVFELEGSDETLQESLRTVANALGRTINASSYLPPVYAERAKDSVREDSQLAAETPQDELFADEDKVLDAPKKEKKRRVARIPQVVDINLDSGSIVFEKFVEQKAPDSDQTKYLVITYWLKEYAGIVEIGSDHAYTCYRRMKWKIPTDPGQPFRGLKKLSYVKSGTTPASFILTHIGETEVVKMGQQ
jgi:hypothetical protein